MSELIEKIMLISLGISLLLLIIPNISQISSLMSYNSNNDENTINSDLNQFIQNMNEFEISRSNQTSITKFNYSGDISVLFENNSQSNSSLFFRFSSEQDSEPNINVVYRSISILNSLIVQIDSVFISSYEFSIQNNSIFLRFF